MTALEMNGYLQAKSGSEEALVRIGNYARGRPKTKVGQRSPSS